MSSYVAALPCSPRLWRFSCLSVMALLLIPQSLAQKTQQADVTYTPSGGWDLSATGGKSDHASPETYFATFPVDASKWAKVTIDASVIFLGIPYPVVATADNQYTTSIGPGVGVFNIPSSDLQHSYNVKISAMAGTPNAASIHINGITLTSRASTTDTDLPAATSTTPRATLPLEQSPSSPSLVVASTPLVNLSSTISNPSLTQSDATSSIIVAPSPAALTTIDPMSGLPSGLLSPPPSTNTYSISDASLTSASSDSSGPSASVIAGAAFGTVIGLCLCIFAAICYRRRRIRNRIPPSTAFMNYRSTTEQPPAYQFSRTSFFQRSRQSFAGGFGPDSKMGYPHPFAPAAGVAGLGYGATTTGSGVTLGAGGRRLMTLDEKSAEGRESARSGSALALSYEDPQRLMTPTQGLIVGDISGMGVGTATGGNALRGLSIDGVARTLTPPPSTTSDKFASTSSLDQNPYDGMAPPEPMPDLPVNPFGTPPGSDSNIAGRGAWGRA